jgi:hypothetical protein
MAIVINEFEVVTEPPKASVKNAETSEPQFEVGQALRPEEVVRVMRRHRERLERVRAD